jgi:hypothetical protein
MQSFGAFKVMKTKAYPLMRYERRKEAKLVSFPSTSQVIAVKMIGVI